MKQRNRKTSLLTMLSAILLAGIILFVPDPEPGEPGILPGQSSEGEDIGGENDINPLSDLCEEKLD